eukprot:jgi/Mesvir1/29130/Mv18429-RA.1
MVLRRFPQKPGETSTSLAHVTSQLLTLMGLVGEVELRGCRHRLPHSRDKAAPPPVLLTFPSREDKQRFLSRRKRLHDLTWTLDDDLTPAQQQQRRDLTRNNSATSRTPRSPRCQSFDIFPVAMEAPTTPAAPETRSLDDVLAAASPFVGIAPAAPK